MALKVDNKKSGVGAENGITNGGSDAIQTAIPYVVRVGLVGASDMLFHRWNSESIEAKGKAAKGSAAKKTDNVESYTYRNDDGELCLPGEYVRQTMIHAAKFRQDPRSPRKSAMDLYKAGIVSLTTLASFGVKDWDYLHSARVVIQRSGVTRIRPAMKVGWKVDMDFMVNLPEYIPVQDFHNVLINAGRLIGVGDFRPSYGRYNVTNIEIQKD